MGKSYKTPSLQRQPLRFEVAIIDDDGDVVTVAAVAEHVRYHRLRGLNALLVGEVHEHADPTGEEELKARRLKLRAVLEQYEGLDESIAPGGVLARGLPLERFIDDPANADLVFATWQAYMEALADPRTFRRDADHRGEGGDAQSASARQVPDPHVPGVRRDEPATDSARSAVSGGAAARGGTPHDSSGDQAGISVEGA